MATDKTIRGARADAYPKQIWWLIAAFVFTVASIHWVSWAFNKLSRRSATSKDSSSDVEGGSSPNRGLSLRRFPVALANWYRVIAFRWTVNFGGSYTLNLAEVFVTCAYIVAIFTWEFSNTTDLEGHRLDISYWGNRAGTIASSQVPLVTVLGTKNNVLSFITGISYDKLNYVHRMTARVVFVLLWVHGGAKFVANPDEITESWCIAGIAAMAGFSLLILVSLRPIRAGAYEFFFLTHFAMVLLFLVGGYVHANNQEYGFYIWPAFLIWGLDRFIRVLRVVVFNHLYFWFTSASPLDGTAELLSPKCVRLRVARPSHFHWAPGQTAYLLMPGVSTLPWEAHPFTIASVDTRNELAGDLEKTDLGESKPYWNELVFLINVRDGFTKHLARRAQTGEKVKVAVDGPYGFSPDLTNDDTVVLVAGGSGITFTLSSFLGVVNDAKAGKSACRRIVFIWSIRDHTNIEWISKTLSKALEVAPPHLAISILIYATGGQVLDLTSSTSLRSFQSSQEGTLAEKAKGSSTSLLASTAVQVINGRPDLHTLLYDEAMLTSGRMSVTVCGSQGMARACRSALNFPLSGGSVLRGGASVILHVESFGYA